MTLRTAGAIGEEWRLTVAVARQAARDLQYFARRDWHRHPQWRHFTYAIYARARVAYEAYRLLRAAAIEAGVPEAALRCQGL